MLNVLVCTECSSKDKAAHTVLSRFRNLVVLNRLEQQVRVSESGCLGACRAGVTIQVGQYLYTGVTEETMDFVFEQYVLDLMQDRVG